MKAMIAAALMAAMLVPSLAYAEDACGELRQACAMKRQLGEQGEGNCKKWRACRAEQCGDLRQACLYKRQAGEQGQGNCARYRDTCRR
jgi:hypothetical protein